VTESSAPPADDSFEELYEHAPVGHLSTTLDGVVIRANATLLRWTGYTAEELRDLRFLELLDAGGRLFYETRFLPVLRLRGEAREVALSLRTADGAALPVIINSVLVTGPDGSPRLIRSAVLDATERQDYERQLLTARRSAETSEARVRILQEASTEFGRSGSVESLAAALAAKARGALTATSASVLLLDESGALRLAAGTDLLSSAGVPEDGRPEAEALRSARIVSLPSVAEAQVRYPGMVDALLGARVEALCVTPLLDEHGIPLGLILCSLGRARDFDEAALEVQEALARQAAEVLTRIRLQRRLERMALHDQLTGLANRKLFHERLGQALASAHRTERPLAVIFLDVDGFKAVNDQLGHAAGDGVLREVSDRLRRVVREYDTVGRLGGDEFVVVCENADQEAAQRIGERIREAVREPLPGVPAALQVTASVGVALHDARSTPLPSPDAILDSADAAMYRSKTGGKDRLVVVQV
jgi:diguanylate cyclase (GGDEF)-like protein/PAS domain S-box-containing protein